MRFPFQQCRLFDSSPVDAKSDFSLSQILLVVSNPFSSRNSLGSIKTIKSQFALAPPSMHLSSSFFELSSSGRVELLRFSTYLLPCSAFGHDRFYLHYPCVVILIRQRFDEFIFIDMFHESGHGHIAYYSRE